MDANTYTFEGLCAVAAGEGKPYGNITYQDGCNCYKDHECSVCKKKRIEKEAVDRKMCPPLVLSEKLDPNTWSVDVAQEPLTSEKIREWMEDCVATNLYAQGSPVIMTSQAIYDRIQDLLKGGFPMDKLQQILREYLEVSELTEDFLEFAKKWEEEKKDEARRLELLGEEEEEDEEDDE